ncbi:DUF551 domain-containing protein [Enterobacter hormaechei]
MTFTKEQLQQIIETDHVQCGDASALARIALASIETDGVAECQHDWIFGGLNKLQSQKQCVKCGRVELVAPPAPVVPDAIEMDDDFDSAFEHGKAVGWNAYRAAMLQSFGNSEQLNSPVIPDGWVACSERMPDIDTEIFYFCKDDGLRDCGIVSSSNFSDSGDAQLYVHAEGYDLRLGVDITHWMPLPAAPQQEVK